MRDSAAYRALVHRLFAREMSGRELIEKAGLMTARQARLPGMYPGRRLKAGPAPESSRTSLRDRAAPDSGPLSGGERQERIRRSSGA